MKFLTQLFFTGKSISEGIGRLAASIMLMAVVFLVNIGNNSGPIFI